MYYLMINTNQHQELSLLEWESVKSDIQEFLSTNRNYHTLEFDLQVEEV